MSRHGVTLVELLVAMVVMGVLGVALVRVIVNNSHFVSRQDAMMEARGTARAAMQAVIPELHTVADSGLRAADRDSVAVRVVYAFGMACRTVSGILTASLMPTDSLTYATASVTAMTWRDTVSGTLDYESPIHGINVSPAADNSPCLPDSIRVIPGGRLVQISGTGGIVPPGALFFLYQRVTYKFAPSASIPGRRGLWRSADFGAWEELAAPFDTSARFAFLMGPMLKLDTRNDFTSQAALDSVRGLELRLKGASVSPPEGSSAPTTFDLRTRVTFMNKRR